MRRKHLSKPLLTALLLLAVLSARAYDFETDGIYYNILSKKEQTCEVTGLYDSSWNIDAYEGEVVIPATTTYLGKTYSVVAIGDDAFFCCSSLTAITIPDAVTSIGYWAFSNCSSLTAITIPDAVTSIAGGAFSHCTSLTAITIPDAVTSIESSAFSNCSSLTAVTIPDAVTSIGNSAFYYCSSLTEITIPDAVTSIGPGAFEDCTSLTAITIPDAVTSIGDYAFRDCTSLAEVTIGSSVTSIGNEAFAYCSVLKSMTSLRTTPPTCTWYTFYNAATSTCVLYVPLGTTSAYSTATGWKNFFNIEEIDVSGVDAVAAPAAPAIVGYYSLDGKVLSAPQQGITIVRYADGTTRTVLAK